MPARSVDVVIVGAGLSGINAAYRLQERNPGLSYVIVENRERIGGTWDLFRYPGVRSDSDIYTLSYPFKAWDGRKAIADGADIRQYLVDVATENGIDRHIEYGVKVTAAQFDSRTDRWTVDATVSGTPTQFRTRFLYLCTGYYDYEQGHAPDFDGLADFTGTVVHPQFWPEDLDYASKKVVVIGSGATAITLVPSLSREAALVTMLQRSPTHISVLPSVDKRAQLLRKYLPTMAAHRMARWMNTVLSLGFYFYCRRFPARARARLRGLALRFLPAGFDVDTHLNPSYQPWDQRLCVVPDADLYRAIRAGKADIVTDTIDHFDATGIALSSGAHLDADIVVMATGLKIQAFGGITLAVDGVTVDPHERFLYRGRMLEGVPNFAWIFGYTNASWTLRSDMTARSVAELLDYMDSHGYTHAYPDRNGKSIPELPMVDLQSGYIQRAADVLPKSSTERPWKVGANVLLDYIDHLRGQVTDSMTFGRVTTPATADR
ncbi:NAD(P)/FAD-dependent oxidoreductase [Williamsia sp. CHRR-6]|uniref:flavin-containing monooxygenase n=1 Tax=Williamsia sp. CHRR-6 TaxID=2835871 RepID=UPI0027DC8323|nr:NAD(P)/FAD-dependent oxidoreductase [Williamsia sp. CHRR-6]